MRETALNWLTGGRKLIGRRGTVGPLDLAEEPGAGIHPVALRGRRRNAEGPGGVVDRQSGEVAELHERGPGRLAGLQLPQRLVEGQEVVGGGIGGQVHVVEIQAAVAAAVLLAPLASSVLDEDAS